LKTFHEYSKTRNDTEFTFCPGCTHGLVLHQLVGAIDDLDLREDAICVGCVGCGGFIPWFLNTDAIYALHGRAPATATGIKRINPGKLVFTYQGDGDLASIGTAEIIHAAHRGENITAIFVNNATYGMTGGQMAPTSLVGQKTTTSPFGRDPAHCGYPIRMCELMATIDGAKFIERVSVDTPANVRKTRKAIKRAFECQAAGQGFSMVEVLSSCPTNWGKTPIDSLRWIKSDMMPYFPLGNYKDY